MGKPGQWIRRALYRHLSLDAYLRALSGMYLLGYRSGLGRGSAYEYPRFLKRLVRPGDTVIDIGANLGYYSYVLAHLAGPEGRVHAVEPVQPIQKVLKHNLRKFKNITIYDVALGDKEETILMGNDSVHMAGYLGTGRNFVMERGVSESKADVTFPSQMRRGSLLFADLPGIDLIKCDIEGYERVVMEEMFPLIHRHRPVVLIETGGENRAFITALFEAEGYAGFVLDKDRMRPAVSEDSKDLILIPEARLPQLQNLIRP